MNRTHTTSASRLFGARSFVCAGMRIGRLQRLGGAKPGPGRDVAAQVPGT